MRADMWSRMIGWITGHVITEIVGEKKRNEECENEIRLDVIWKRNDKAKAHLLIILETLDWKLYGNWS